MTKRLALILAALLASGRLAQAADGNGTVSGAFLRLPPSAAAAGMGEAGAAVVSGSPAIFINPAGLANVRGGYASFSRAAWADTLSFNAVSAAFNTPYGGVAGVGLRYLSYGKMDSRDNTGADAGSISPRDLAVDAGWAAEIEPGFSAGFTGRYIESRIKNTASTFAADAGVTKRVGRTFFGAVLQNVGGELKYNKEGAPLPRNLKLGVALPYGPDILGMFDINVTQGAQPWLAVGGKYTSFLRDGMAMILRAGYNTSASDTGGINGFTLGLGLSTPDFAVDYALRTMGDLGPTHHIGVSFRWDIVYPEVVDAYGPAPVPPSKRARPQQRPAR